MRESSWLVKESDSSITDKRICSGEMSRGARGRGKGGFVPRNRVSCGSQTPNVSTTNSVVRGSFGMYSQPTLQESSSSRSFENIFANIKPPNPARAQLFVKAQKRDARENCSKLDDEDDNRCNFCGSASHRSRFCTVLTEQSNPTAHITCNYCKRKGHYKADCPKQPGNRISKKKKKCEGVSNNSSSASNSAENVAGKGASKESGSAIPQWSKVNVPMPVPSSLKVVVKLKSQPSFNDDGEKIKDAVTPSATITLDEMQCKSTYRSGRRIADSCVIKAPPKFTYCRSDSDEYATDNDSDVSSLGGKAVCRKKNIANDNVSEGITVESKKKNDQGEGVLTVEGGVAINGSDAVNIESENDAGPKSVDNKHLEALGRMLKESLCLTKKPSSSEELKTSHPSTIGQSKDEPDVSKVNGLMRMSSSSNKSVSEEGEMMDEESWLAPKICVDFDSESDFTENEKGDDDDNSDEVHGVILPLDARQ